MEGIRAEHDGGRGGRSGERARVIEGNGNARNEIDRHFALGRLDRAVGFAWGYRVALAKYLLSNTKCVRERELRRDKSKTRQEASTEVSIIYQLGGE